MKIELAEDSRVGNLNAVEEQDEWMNEQFRRKRMIRASKISPRSPNLAYYSAMQDF